MLEARAWSQTAARCKLRLMSLQKPIVENMTDWWETTWKTREVTFTLPVLSKFHVK